MTSPHADTPPAPAPLRGPHTLLATTGGAEDVLLCGPAARAASAGSSRVTMLCRSTAVAAGRLLEGVDEVLAWEPPWSAGAPAPASGGEALLAPIRRCGADAAAVIGTPEREVLALTLVLRLAGVPRTAAVVDPSGALVQHPVAADPTRHEARTNLAVLAALGFALPPSGHERLQVRLPAEDAGDVAADVAGDDADALMPRRMRGRRRIRRDRVVVHPAASLGRGPAALSGERLDAIIDQLIDDGWNVLVTGSAQAPHPPARPRMVDLIGRTDLAGLAAVVAGCVAAVVGSATPAQLAAAVGTPVVSVLGSDASWSRRRPWRVPAIRLRADPAPGPGLAPFDEVTPEAVGAAVRSLTGPPSLFATEPGVRRR